MNPNGQLPSDYLDQIAPKAQKSSFLNGKMRQIAIIGAALVVLVIIASIFTSISSGGQKDNWSRLSLRIDATNEIVTDANKNIKSNKLRVINTEIKLFLTNLNRDIQDPLATVGVNTEKISQSLQKEVSVSTALANLEEARLNDVYDRTYAREMTYQLAQLLTDLQKVYNGSKNEDNKKFLEESYTSLEATHKTLSDYSAAND